MYPIDFLNNPSFWCALRPYNVCRKAYRNKSINIGYADLSFKRFTVSFPEDAYINHRSRIVYTLTPVESFSLTRSSPTKGLNSFTRLSHANKLVASRQLEWSNASFITNSSSDGSTLVGSEHFSVYLSGDTFNSVIFLSHSLEDVILQKLSELDRLYIESAAIAAKNSIPFPSKYQQHLEYVKPLLLDYAQSHPEFLL